MEIQVSKNLVSQLAADGKLQTSNSRTAKEKTSLNAAKLDRSFDKFIEKAMSNVEDSTAVEAARKDLQDGKLESQSAYLSVADNLLALGI